MLRIRLICVGKLKERFYTEAVAEYLKRLSAFCRLEPVELQEERLSARPSQAEIDAALRKEAAEIEKNLLKDAKLVCMCVEGEAYSSEEFSDLLTSAETNGPPRLCFVVGGSYGLDAGLKRKADLCLSMSKMTFPHHLARVMLLEQLYRGFQIREGSKYHK
jgi:23S rRNA (pseudouridine1915-N3)-methyltransferase